MVIFSARAHTHTQQQQQLRSQFSDKLERRGRRSASSAAPDDRTTWRRASTASETSPAAATPGRRRRRQSEVRCCSAAARCDPDTRSGLPENKPQHHTAVIQCQQCDVRHNTSLRRWLHQRFDFDSTVTELTALRPFDDIRYDCSHCSLSK